MNVHEAVRMRRSIRSYRPKPVKDEELNRVLDAARHAPSARNMENWKLVVVRDREKRERLMRAAHNQSFVAQAPIVIAACGTVIDHVMSCGQLSYTIDAAIAVDHMTLQAVEEGLGTCWVCAFDEAEVKKILGIPEDVRVVALLTLGYPAEAPEARSRRRPDEIAAYETYA